MEHETVWYYDGSSARPKPVRVLLFDDGIELYDEPGGQLLFRVLLAHTTHNQVGGTHYFYLDAQGLRYLQFASGHPLAADMVHRTAGVQTGWFQRLLRQRIIVLLPLAGTLAVALYFLLITLVPFLGTRLIGVEQEIAIGARLKEAMLQEARTLGAEVDTAGTRRLQAFADQLKLSAHYPIQVTLLRSKVVNAYALPGGQVVVYSGILEKIKTPEALAALLAHESTHINERHSLRSLLRSAAHGILISVVFSDVTGVSGALAGNAEALNGLHYSRSLEAEADEKGMDLLLQNRVDVQGMLQLMQALQELGDLPGSLSLLSTHPLTKDRIEAVKQYRKKHPQQEEPREDLKNIFKELK